jgi:hypothetical protein
LGNKFGKEKKGRNFVFFNNEVFLSCVALAHSITLGGKKAYQVKKSKFFVFVFCFSSIKIKLEIQNKKREKEMGRKEKLHTNF